MTNYRFGRLMLLVILVLCAGPLVCAAQANTYTETFDGPLPSFFTVITSGHGETVSVSGGKLVITIPSHTTGSYYAGIQTTFNTGTAFQSQVDYNLTTWPQWYDWTIQAGLWGASGEMNAIRTQRNDYGYHDIVSANFHGNQYQKYVDDNLSGSLLLWRNSSSGAGGKYYIPGFSDFKEIGGYSPQYSDGPFVLQVTSGSGAGAVEVRFDNFKITGDNVVVPLPPAALLLGSGLLGLGLTGWRRRRKRA